MNEFDEAQTLTAVGQTLIMCLTPHQYSNAIVLRVGEWGLDDAIVIAFPKRALEFYFQRRSISVDPFLRHSFCSVGPFFWSDITQDHRPSEAEQDFVSVMAELGVRDGVTIPLPPFGGRRAILSLSRKKYTTSKRGSLAQLSHLGARFWQRWLTLDCAGHDTSPFLAKSWTKPSLTKRQISCLQYCQEGYTSQEIGEAIGICENTVQFHISNAMLELGANNRINAVARAIELGLFEGIESLPDRCSAEENENLKT